MTDDLTLAEGMAFVFHRGGAEGLREVLAHTLNLRGHIVSSELLLEQAEELRTMGLISAAQVIEDVASTTPHEWDLPCPIPPDCILNVKAWHKEMEAKRKEWEQRNS
jgi:hypothetical protein